jgi:hypothetical protein
MEGIARLRNYHLTDQDLKWEIARLNKFAEGKKSV